MSFFVLSIFGGWLGGSDPNMDLSIFFFVFLLNPSLSRQQLDIIPPSSINLPCHKLSIMNLGGQPQPYTFGNNFPVVEFSFSLVSSTFMYSTIICQQVNVSFVQPSRHELQSHLFFPSNHSPESRHNSAKIGIHFDILRREENNRFSFYSSKTF